VDDPQEAIAKNNKGEIILMPPTLTTLSELSAFESLDDALAAGPSRTMHVIMPQGFKYDGGFG